MNGRLLLWRENLQTSLWPVPLLMLVLGVVLFQLAAWVDRSGMVPAAVSGWLRNGTGDDARNLLSTLVTAIITISSLVFSITLVALSLAAAQFGSRLLRTYMADLRTKLAVGLFSMTIVYCLLTLRAVSAEMPASQVPQVSVSLAFLLGLVCVLILLLFLHLVAHSIVADEVIKRVVLELEANIATLPPLDPGRPTARFDESMLARYPPPGRVRSKAEGYVQAIAYDQLTALAARHDAVVRLQIRPGDFVSKDGSLAFVYARAPAPDLAAAIDATVIVGGVRTPTQDLEFTFRQLIDIALRALSAAINDANTALVVIDRLSGALGRLMAKALPPQGHCDGSGQLRVLTRPNSHGDVIDAALRQIRQAGASDPAVVIRLLLAIERVAEHVRLPEQRDALLRNAQLAASAGLKQTPEGADRDAIEQALAAATETLQGLVFGAGASAG